MSERWLDRAGAVRPGQEVDVEALDRYLRAYLPELPSEGPLRVEQFPSGYSNLTYLVRRGDHAMVLRRPPLRVAIATAHDMAREHRILSRLPAVFAQAPRSLAYCADPSVIGTPFLLMERVEGVILRKEMPDGLEVPAPLARAVALGLVDTLAALHGVEVESAGLTELGRPAGYVRRQIDGWTRRYRAAETETVPEADRVAAWLDESIPEREGASLIHNDFKHDNVVLDPSDWSRVRAVLDWEMATRGDPLMDLGTSLAYWTEPSDPEVVRATRLSPTLLPGTPGRAEVVQAYAVASGRDMEDIVFYYVYGLFKVAVIVQQLHHRFVSGRTQDARFANLIAGVRALSTMAWQAAQRKRIDDLF